MHTPFLWNAIKKPIIGLSPMDGITDPAFRYVIDSLGHPSVLFTEFVSSEGLSRGIIQLTQTFSHHTTTTPLIGQLFGATPDSLYLSTILLCAIGMDGIDINMGCPNHHITKSGGGAALIKTPDLAKKLILKTKEACRDWANGIKLSDLDIPKKFHQYMLSQFKNDVDRKRTLLPVSVKTRIGLEIPDTVHWISHLLEADPSAITLHGRTLVQMYEGTADWEEIGKAAELAKKTSTLLLGNGDITSKKDAEEKAQTYTPDGVLIGRGAWGNPWVFTDRVPTIEDRINGALVHCDAFLAYTPHENVLSLRKHIAWYCKGFPNATDVRTQIMQLSTIDEIKEFLKNLKIKN